MLDLKKVKQEIETVGNMGMLTQAYQEISVTRMQRVRSSVIITRQFLEQLSEVFVDVKANYRAEVDEILRRRFHMVIKPERSDGSQQNQISQIEMPEAAKKIPSIQKFIKKKDKVLVFLSSNTRLYGDLIQKIFNLFVEQVRNTSSDLVIIGSFGQELFDNLHTGRQYTYFELQDVHPTPEEYTKIIEYLLEYETVEVVYGKFDTVITQKAAESNISGQEALSRTQVGIPQKPLHFEFEPSLEIVLALFSTQIFESLFKQTVRETELTRYAARISAMEEAQVKIELTQKLLIKDEKTLHSRLENKKQLDRLAGMSLWNE